MSNIAHTRGPWHVTRTDNVVFETENQRAIAWTWADDMPYVKSAAERKLNAHLIAAAPDMLAALKAIVEYETSPDFSKWALRVDAARAAVAKAEGRP